ncbi:hypothetical protein A2U01_0087742, partial [Trifolium medium]|nr:hypothetical protein [Trifolium medium]
ARNLTTRAELVERIKKPGEDVFKVAKYSWENALAQLQIVNPDVKFTTEGIGMLRNVRLVIPLYLLF